MVGGVAGERHTRRGDQSELDPVKGIAGDVLKLHFPVPMRYSEDIDLIRTTSGPVGPVLARVREVLEPWLGHAAFDRSPVAPKLRFKTPVEDNATPPEIRMKLEINTREIDAYDPLKEVEFGVDNPRISLHRSAQ